MTNHIAFCQFWAALRRRGTLAVCLALCILGLAVSATAQKPTIITINPAGAGRGAWQGTQGPGINPAETITGFYSDSNNVYHGFLRAPDGRITTFDAPGAGRETVSGFFPTAIGVLGGQGTYAISINPEGAISGAYMDQNNVIHGFLRHPDGKFTTIDDPYAGRGAGQGTEAGNINQAGVIAGTYWDGSGLNHGYVRTPDGKFTEFDVTGAGTAPGQGTIVAWASCLNPAGAITGYYVDGSNVFHGYVRAPNGTITPFDVTGAGTGPGQGTLSWSINPAGDVTAEYVDAENVSHGYVRAPHGAITKFDFPGAGTSAGQGTIGEGINTEGVVAGNYIDASGVTHGYVRMPDGRFAKFDAPHAGTGSGQGTIPLTINPAGAITGAYVDNENVIHGFLLIPRRDERLPGHGVNP